MSVIHDWDPYTVRQTAREFCLVVSVCLVGLLIVLGAPSWVVSIPEARFVPTAAAAPRLLVAGAALAGGLDDATPADSTNRTVVHSNSSFATGTDPLARWAPTSAARSPFLNVVVQGGEADVGQPAGAVEKATLHMIDRLRAQIDQGSSITVVGPIPDGAPSPALLRVRNELAAAAANKGVRFIDPIERGLRADQPDLRQQIDVLLSLDRR